MLNDHGLHEHHIKGGHATFEDQKGYKVTIPVHSPHLSDAVRRSLMQQVNAKQ